VGMFVVDDFVAECRAALTESEPLPAIREVLDRALSAPSEVADVLADQRGGIRKLYNAPDLTVLNVIWAPKMTIMPHDHRMWASIGIYAGGEDNAFYRREGATIVDSGGKELRERDVLLLGDDAIHSVTNPLRSYTGAIHVYGGDFFAEPRSQWDLASRQEKPYDHELVARLFEESNKEVAE